PPLSSDPSGRAWARRAFFDLLGRGPQPAEADKALAGPREKLLDDLFARDELYQEWLEAQGSFLLLVHGARPSGEPFASLATKLRAGEVTPRAVLELTAGKPFEQRFAANDAFVGTVLSRLLGIDLQGDEGRSLLEAGKRMADGQPETLLGKQGKS